MTGKLVEKLPGTMNTLMNPLPDNLYPEEIPNSLNIFSGNGEATAAHYNNQMATDNVMDIGLASDKPGQDLSSYSGSFQPAPGGNKTVTYLGKFAFDSPSNWCQDNIISLMSAGILGVPPPSSSAQASTGSLVQAQSQAEVDGMYPALPPYSTCSDLYPGDPVSFHDPQGNAAGLAYPAQDYQGAKPASSLDGNLFPMIPDYNLYHGHPNDLGSLPEHKPFQNLDPIRVNPPPITPLETIKAFKDKQIHPGFGSLQGGTKAQCLLPVETVYACVCLCVEVCVRLPAEGFAFPGSGLLVFAAGVWGQAKFFLDSKRGGGAPSFSLSRAALLALSRSRLVFWLLLPPPPPSSAIYLSGPGQSKGRKGRPFP
ncbi:early growth response protein 3 [Python bivittatus]|uniref:Early growth response protein 3 n=1 Tax=Python bivittatus TaxID=176946 RepID=A0A9F2WGP5_PYTBI|nr:early growth response protein 3 [Python bivittatus]